VIQKIRKGWDDLHPRMKKRLCFTAVGVFVGGILLIICVSRSRESDSRKPVPPDHSTQEFSLGVDSRSLQKSTLRDIENSVDDLQKKVNQMVPGLHRSDEVAPAADTSALPGHSLPGQSPSLLQQTPPPPPIPPPPQVEGGSGMPSPQANALFVPPPPADLRPLEEFVGSIEQVAISAAVGGKTEGEVEKKKIYLPPSFMAATLLSGLDAPAIDMGKGNPVPVLIRIRDLAFLPNSVKADLKGCFTIADGHGSLADERAHLRLVTLSCLSRKGQAVVDQSIKGFVVDEDGKIGIRGKVVSRMGSVIARVALAGFISGVGKGLNESTMMPSLTPSGVTNVPDPSKAGLSGVGSGLSAAVDKLSEFYLRLAEATLPVIEVGSNRKITMVIQEGTTLDIKPLGTPSIK
jgi:conjugal transfer pilus assembly protein TraB